MISLFFANLIGWITLHWRRLVLACLGAFLLILVIGFVFRSCKRSTVKIDEEQIQKINKQNEAERKEELKVVIDKNAETVKTVDGRTEIVNLSVEERDKATAEKVKEVDAKIQEAKSQGKDVSQEELVCLLQPENCK